MPCNACSKANQPFGLLIGTFMTRRSLGFRERNKRLCRGAERLRISIGGRQLSRDIHAEQNIERLERAILEREENEARDVGASTPGAV